MSEGRRIGLLLAGGWALVMLTALLTRPPLPVDETRYLAVAWEMWRDGRFLVPHLNGEAYSHKPPLLFWLMQAGWALFGVSEWWPRLVAPLMGLGNLFLVIGLARKLWPETRLEGRAAALILFGCAFWTLFTTLTMFDMMLAFFAQVALAGLLHAWRRGGAWGWLAFGAGIGFGVLTKGPAILLHTLPVALLAPLWAPKLPGPAAAPSWRIWYAGTVGGVLLGAAIGLAWALPAGFAGGEAYREAIFWGQSADRMVDSFAHARPWWWYLAVLPPLVLPWTVWPPLWRGLRGLVGGIGDGGIRFALAWFLPAFLAFSAISGKQLHYLLPEFPALALLLARLMRAVPVRDWDRWPVAAISALLGLAVLALPLVDAVFGLPRWEDAIAPAWGGLLLVAAAVVAWWRPETLLGRLTVLLSFPVGLVLAAHLVMQPHLAGAFDLGPVARKLGDWERQGYALAHYGKYHGQFHFQGRLQNAIDEVGDGEIDAWLAAHPRGKIISYRKKPPETAEPDLIRRFRSDLLLIWDADAGRRDPDLLKRSS